MKKILFFAAALIAMTACNGSKNKAAATSADSTSTDTTAVSSDSMVYEGEGPAADGSYQYHLTLKEGPQYTEFTFLEVGITPSDTDTTAMSSGLAALHQHNGKTYVRIATHPDDSLTFLQVDKQTLRLVRNDFSEPDKGMPKADLKLQNTKSPASVKNK